MKIKTNLVTKLAYATASVYLGIAVFFWMVPRKATVALAPNCPICQVHYSVDAEEVYSSIFVDIIENDPSATFCEGWGTSPFNLELTCMYDGSFRVRVEGYEICKAGGNQYTEQLRQAWISYLEDVLSNTMYCCPQNPQNHTCGPLAEEEARVYVSAALEELRRDCANPSTNCAQCEQNWSAPAPPPAPTFPDGGCPSEEDDCDDDGIPDDEDLDDDNDGVLDAEDVCLCDPTNQCDLDGDGIPDPVDPCINEANDPTFCTNCENDFDCDGIDDDIDPCQGGPNECSGCTDDQDCDGIPDDEDDDADGDGQPDEPDDCDNPDDSDCDGCLNADDPYPNNPRIGCQCDDPNDQDCDSCPTVCDPDDDNPRIGCAGTTGDCDGDGCGTQFDPDDTDATVGCPNGPDDNCCQSCDEQIQTKYDEMLELFEAIFPEFSQKSGDVFSMTYDFDGHVVKFDLARGFTQGVDGDTAAILNPIYITSISTFRTILAGITYLYFAYLIGFLFIGSKKQ